jgi:hypothetical protein
MMCFNGGHTGSWLLQAPCTCSNPQAKLLRGTHDCCRSEHSKQSSCEFCIQGRSVCFQGKPRVLEVRECTEIVEHVAGFRLAKIRYFGTYFGRMHGNFLHPDTAASSTSAMALMNLALAQMPVVRATVAASIAARGLRHPAAPRRQILPLASISAGGMSMATSSKVGEAWIMMQTSHMHAKQPLQQPLQTLWVTLRTPGTRAPDTAGHEDSEGNGGEMRVDAIW